MEADLSYWDLQISTDLEQSDNQAQEHQHHQFRKNKPFRVNRTEPFRVYENQPLQKGHNQYPPILCSSKKTPNKLLETPANYEIKHNKRSEPPEEPVTKPNKQKAHKHDKTVGELHTMNSATPQQIKTNICSIVKEGESNPKEQRIHEPIGRTNQHRIW